MCPRTRDDRPPPTGYDPDAMSEPSVTVGGFHEVLASEIGVAPQEHGHIQLAILLPRAVTCGATGALILLVQNPYDGRVFYRVELKQYPEPLSSLRTPDVQICKRVEHHLNPGESGALEFPFFIKESARSGTHALDLRISTFNDSKGFFRSGFFSNRVYPLAQQLKPKADSSLAAKNLLGLGLAATTGLGFLTFPTGGSFFRLRYVVSPGEAGVPKPESVAPTFRSFWRPEGSETFEAKFSSGDARVK